MKKSQSTVLGIIGFILGLIGLLLVNSFGIFLAIPGLILCIIQIKRNKTKLAIIGLILNIIVIIISTIILIFVIVVWKTVAEGVKEVEPQTGCLTLNLKINEINADLDNIEVERMAGVGDLGKIKILINGGSAKEVDALDMYELTKKDISININSGDEVQIIPVLTDGTVCTASDTKIVG